MIRTRLQGDAPFFPSMLNNGKVEVCLKEDVDKVIAEKDKEIAELKARIQLDDDEMAGFLQLEEECGGGDLRNYIAELKQKLDKAIAERDGNQVCIDALKAEIKRKEGVGQRWFERCMKERTENVRLKRALFIAHAIKAKFKWWWMSECKHNESCKLIPDPRKIKKFTNSAWVCSKSQEKCRAKAEQYK